MSVPAKKLLTISDFIKFPQNSRAELIDGEIIHKALPSGRHADIQLQIGSCIRTAFHKKKKPNEPSGWWIASEVSIYYSKLERILTADLAGWLRSRVSEKPISYPIYERPDWVCEVSISTLKKDTTVVFETLQTQGVPYYWIVNEASEQLMVYELINDRYSLIQSLFREDGSVRIKPFDAVEINMGVIFGDEID